MISRVGDIQGRRQVGKRKRSEDEKQGRERFIGKEEYRDQGTTEGRENILDLVLTNAPENILSVEGLGNLNYSEHTLICVEVDFNPKFQKSDELILDWYNGETAGIHEFYSNIENRNKPQWMTKFVIKLRRKKCRVQINF